MKNYFFRDLDHTANLRDGRTFHAAGIAILHSEISKPCPSGKDVEVCFLHPFIGKVCCEWRSFKDIELFEVEEWEFGCMNEFFCKVEACNLTS